MTAPVARQLLTYRGWASRIYLPSPAMLDKLPAGLMPYAFVPFDSSRDNGGNVDAQQYAEGFSSQPGGCWITHLVGSAVNSDSSQGNVVVQFFDAPRSQLWSNQPIILGNSLGTALYPLWLKKPYLLPPNQQLQCRVINLSASLSTAIQVVAWGLRP